MVVLVVVGGEGMFVVAFAEVVKSASVNSSRSKSSSWNNSTNSRRSSYGGGESRILDECSRGQQIEPESQSVDPETLNLVFADSGQTSSP